jgi:hypothetical protein
MGLCSAAAVRRGQNRGAGTQISPCEAKTGNRGLQMTGRDADLDEPHDIVGVIVGVQAVLAIQVATSLVLKPEEEEMCAWMSHTTLSEQAVLARPGYP